MILDNSVEAMKALLEGKKLQPLNGNDDAFIFIEDGELKASEDYNPQMLMFTSDKFKIVSKTNYNVGDIVGYTDSKGLVRLVIEDSEEDKNLRGNPFYTRINEGD